MDYFNVDKNFSVENFTHFMWTVVTILSHNVLKYNNKQSDIILLFNDHLAILLYKVVSIFCL